MKAESVAGSKVEGKKKVISYTHEEIKGLIFEKISYVTGVDESELKLENTLESMGVDSLDVIDFVYNLEGEFGFKLETTDLRYSLTIADIIILVKNKVKVKK